MKNTLSFHEVIPTKGKEVTTLPNGQYLAETVTLPYMKTMEHEFTVLIQQHRGIIFKVIRLYVNHEEDEKDLYQEILYQVWKSLPSFEGKSKFSTWLYRVSLNTALSFIRKIDSNGKHQTLENVDIPLEQHGLSEETTMLYQAIKQLSEVDRLLITLHLDGYSHDEIAEIAGITKNHVTVKLFRIRESLTKKLKAY
jgi:RNA polymerase sigma-70 factor (ECF subfamily)